MIASVLQLLKLPDGTVKVLVEGGVRVDITKHLDNQAYYEAECETIIEDQGDERTRSAMRSVAPSSMTMSN